MKIGSVILKGRSRELDNKIKEKVVIKEHYIYVKKKLWKTDLEKKYSH